jgi:hypothetical protein
VLLGRPTATITISIANPAKGEPVGERGLPNQGYQPGRKTARRQDDKKLKW